MEIFQDLKEFVELLRENKVEYMVIGGYAWLFIPDLILLRIKKRQGEKKI